jgi:hypothetical protein
MATISTIHYLLLSSARLAIPFIHPRRGERLSKRVAAVILLVLLHLRRTIRLVCLLPPTLASLRVVQSGKQLIEGRLKEERRERLLRHRRYGGGNVPASPSRTTFTSSSPSVFHPRRLYAAPSSTTPARPRARRPYTACSCSRRARSVDIHGGARTGIRASAPTIYPRRHTQTHPARIRPHTCTSPPPPPHAPPTPAPHPARHNPAGQHPSRRSPARARPRARSPSAAGSSALRYSTTPPQPGRAAVPGPATRLGLPIGVVVDVDEGDLAVCEVSAATGEWTSMLWDKKTPSTVQRRAGVSQSRWCPRRGEGRRRQRANAGQILALDVGIGIHLFPETGRAPVAQARRAGTPPAPSFG